MKNVLIGVALAIATTGIALAQQKPAPKGGAGATQQASGGVSVGTVAIAAAVAAVAVAASTSGGESSTGPTTGTTGTTGTR